MPPEKQRLTGLSGEAAVTLSASAAHSIPEATADAAVDPQPRRVGVVISTYNQPAWLGKVLLGYESQTTRDFTVMIADDGSGPATREVIQFFRARGRLKLQHLWHADEGFRKCRILNQAITQTDCDYLIFTDGDCIPEPRLVETHRRLAMPGHFLSGGYIKLTRRVSERISEEHISRALLFDAAWLVSQGQPRSSKLLKLVRSPWLKSLLNRFTPTRATWNGMNSSTWTADLRACNGFNEDMQYGGLDRELGERLVNRGLKGKQVRYSINCLHLDHPRAYDTPQTWAKNDAIRREVRRTGRFWTPNGITRS